MCNYDHINYSVRDVAGAVGGCLMAMSPLLFLFL